MGINLIRQGIIGEDFFSLSQSDSESGNNGKRQFLQLLWSELSLYLAYLLS